MSKDFPLEVFLKNPIIMEFRDNIHSEVYVNYVKSMKVFRKLDFSRVYFLDFFRHFLNSFSQNNSGIASKCFQDHKQ